MAYPWDDGFRGRYQNEPAIRQVVDVLIYALVTEHITSHDLARCAVLAAQLYAERYAAPLTIVLDINPPPEAPSDG